MEFAYLDESGDLGGGGSKNLVLTLLCTPKKKEIVKIIRDTKKRLLDHNKSARWLNKHGGEIKFHSFPDKDILKRTLQKLSMLDTRVYYLCLEKAGETIEEGSKRLILGQLFSHIFEFGGKTKPAKIIADLNFFNNDKINRFLLKEYVVDGFKLNQQNGKEMAAKKTSVRFTKLAEPDYEKLKNNPESFIVEIEHQNSRLCEELQALDLICGSIFAHHEHSNPEYFDILHKGKMVVEGVNLSRKR